MKYNLLGVLAMVILSTCSGKSNQFESRVTETEEPKQEQQQQHTEQDQEQQVESTAPTQSVTTSNRQPAVDKQPVLTIPGKDSAVASNSGFENQLFNIHAHQIWDEILKKHISSTGNVDYAGIKKDRPMLDQYLKQLEESPVADSWSRSQKLAYWINAYNAFTVELIIEHYPLESIRDIDRPWGKKFIKLGDKMYSLNQIEHDIIRPVFKEPRIHFAVVCAAVSCPRLLNAAYLPETLDQQLDAQTHYFLNQSGKNELSTKLVRISQLFNWYGKDFKQQGSIVDFLNRYANQEISAKAKVEFLKYDWSLND